MNLLIALFRGAFQPPGSGEMGPRIWGWEYHMGLFSVILIGLFWIAVIVAILFFIRWLLVSRPSVSGDPGGILRPPGNCVWRLSACPLQQAPRTRLI
jgi:hypothetical protein